MSNTAVKANPTSAQIASHFSLSRHAVIGAMIAAFLAALWVSQYLTNTLASIDLSWVVMGDLFNGLNEAGAEALFVIVTRFLLAFVFGWGPITVILAFVRRDRGNS